MYVIFNVLLSNVHQVATAFEINGKQLSVRIVRSNKPYRNTFCRYFIDHLFLYQELAPVFR